MPFSYSMDEPSGILWQKGEGFITLAEILEFVREVRQANLAVRDSIVDLSGVTGSDLTRDHIALLAGIPQRAARMAIVAPQEARFGRARMFELMAESQHATTVRVFRTAEEALLWLRSGVHPDSAPNK